jgi:hypothetical protein
MARPLALASLLCAALAAPAQAGAPFPFFGVHVTQADLTACDDTSVDGAITLFANVPDDGRTWGWAWFSEARGGGNFASAADGQFGLAATAGDILLENTGSLLVGTSSPGALGDTYDFSYVARTYADGVLVFESTITSRCEAGEPTATVVESRLARPTCGPPVTACEVVVLPKATLRVRPDVDGARVSLKASGAAAPLDHFQDPTLALAEGGATTATCFYDGAFGLIGAVGADAALLDAKSKPRWKRKASATKIATKYADPKGDDGTARSLGQTSGPKAKIALSARDVPIGVANFLPNGVIVQQRTVNPRDRVFTCTEVYFPPDSLKVDVEKGTAKGKVKGPDCGPGCP